MRGSNLVTESRVFLGGHQEPAHNSFGMVIYIYISISPKNKGGGRFKHLFVFNWEKSPFSSDIFQMGIPKKGQEFTIFGRDPDPS